MALYLESIKSILQRHYVEEIRAHVAEIRATA